MGHVFRVAVVDDDLLSRTLLTKTLEEGYTVLAFESGNAFLAANVVVDVVLLDIEMPGDNGFEVCRQFRMRESSELVPVVFISGHDEPDQRLAAFESGGDDFIIKPIVKSEVRHKVENLLSQENRIRDLRSESDMARQMAFTAMSSMGDLGVVLEFMRGSANVRDYRALADALCVALKAWDLKGSVQIRGDGITFQRATESEQYPLQGSVMETLKDMGRIFQMGSRGIINYPHVSLLVQNLPVDQPEKVGALRDLLAMLAESADARVDGIDMQNQALRTKADARESLDELKSLLAGLANKVRKAQSDVSMQMHDLSEDVFMSLKSMSMTPVQQGMVTDLMQGGTHELLTIFEQSTNFEEDFARLVKSLDRMAS